MVRRRLAAFEYRGKLDRQHYSFCKTALVSPFPVYHHLIFCYNRTGRKLQVRVGCSLLHGWQLKRNPGRITYQTGVTDCDLSGHARFVQSRGEFESELQRMLDESLPEFTDRLLHDEELVGAMHSFLAHRKLPKEKHSSKFESDIRLVMKQRGLLEQEAIDKSELPKRDEFDAFMADLVPENALKSEGSFSLNAAKAAQKLQRYQLSTPQNFVVHLVGGAIAGGATKVDVYIDSDDIVVDFDGEPLVERDVAGVLDSMFNPHAEPRLREFGVALNAAASLEPLALRIDSWNGERGFSLDLRRGSRVKPLLECPFEDPSRPAHRISFRDKPNLRVARRFLNSLSRTHPEVNLVEERCRFAPVPVHVLGQDRRFFPLDETVAALRWEHPDHPVGDLDLSRFPGVAEKSNCDFSVVLLVGPEPAFHISVNGVLYDAPVGEKSPPVWCLVAHNGLQRDLSYSGVNDDHKWEQVCEQLELATARLLDFVDTHFPATKGPERKATAKLLRDFYHTGYLRALSHPIFPTLDDRYASANQICQSHTTYYTHQAWEYPLRSGEPVYQLSERDLATLTELVARKKKWISRDEELRSSQIYFQKREQWLALEPTTPVLPKGKGPIRELKNGMGQLGLQKKLGPAKVELFCSGRPLSVSWDSGLPNGFRAVVNHDELEVNDEWTEVISNASLYSVLERLNQEMVHFYSSFRRDPEFTDHQLSYLLYRKRQGQGFRELMQNVVFRMRDGSTRTWSQLSEEEGMAGLEALWLKTFHLSLRQRQLLSSLFS